VHPDLRQITAADKQQVTVSVRRPPDLSLHLCRVLRAQIGAANPHASCRQDRRQLEVPSGFRQRRPNVVHADPSLR
jgi:hypothetical protein